MRPGSGSSRRRTRSRCTLRASSVSATRFSPRPSVSSRWKATSRCEEAVEVGDRDGRFLVAEVARQGVARLGGKAAGGLGRDVGLDCLPRHHPLQHVVEADARDVGALLRLDQREALVGEAVDRGVHRQAGHAEAQAEGRSVDRGAGRQLAADDRLLQREMDLVGLGRPPVAGAPADRLLARKASPRSSASHRRRRQAGLTCLR